MLTRKPINMNEKIHKVLRLNSAKRKIDSFRRCAADAVKRGATAAPRCDMRHSLL